MDCGNKIYQLQSEIRSQLDSLIGYECILADAPYYDNIGDILIWQGIHDFLNETGHKLLKSTSMRTFDFKPIPKNITILLTGGGNFGDLWRTFQEFRLKVIEAYPNNRIVMFPQSVWYENMSIVSQDAEILSRHSELYLCARDLWSYDFMRKNFPKCKILLVPDMAFYINDKILQPFRGKDKKINLFLRRLDKEIASSTPATVSNDAEIHDWPTVEKKMLRCRIINRLCYLSEQMENKFLKSVLNIPIDYFAKLTIRKGLVRIGLDFLSMYSHITTTRLHAMILSILLHKPVDYLDNITGKLSAFTETWLSELESVRSFKL